jgi:hypothetical protein
MPIKSTYFSKILALTLWLLIMLTGAPLYSQYIHQVIEYQPAPGQFINKPPFGHPNAPNSIVGTLEGALSLGAFGGYMVFRFENPVQNHPDNPYGIDFIIFGNPMPTFSEPGIVSVMKDENGNGLPDDTWYELAGSDYFFSNTLYQNQVTYINPGGIAATDVAWSDQFGNQGQVKASAFHTQTYYPLHSLFPPIDSVSQTYTGTRIMGMMDHSGPSSIISHRRAFGYTDNRPRGTAPFNMPGNPYIPTIENAGADGFDISWAVDVDGNYVDLDEIHFIKVHTAMQANAGWLGEISTEITGAIVVEPNSNITGVTEMVVIKDLPPVITELPIQLEAFAFNKGRIQQDKKIRWSTNMDGALVDDQMMLHASSPGQITITATLEGKPAIMATVSTLIDLSSSLISIPGNDRKISLYPNPAREYIYLDGIENGAILIYNPEGRLVRQQEIYSRGERIAVSELPQGIYFLKVISGAEPHTFRFVKRK